MSSSDANSLQSPLFAIRDTPNSGRGVFALKELKAGTLLLNSSVTPAFVILREYQREVCAHCFIYERGRRLKHRCPETGHFFCSPPCQKTWEDEFGSAGTAAWTAFETFVKAKHHPTYSNGKQYDYLPDAATGAPSIEDVRARWEQVESTAHFIRQCRAGSNAKPHRRALLAALNVPPNADVLGFQLSGALARDRKLTSGWQSLMQLVPDETPYAQTQELSDHVHAYLHLLALVPVFLLPHVTAEACLELAKRDSHNSFGIRSLDDGGDEFFGFGVWPEASFFNHSCAPNVAKRRIGRAWEFLADTDVADGGELCISYLGGEEREMNLQERQTRLSDVWGFTCACAKCFEESGEVQVDCDERSAKVD